MWAVKIYALVWFLSAISAVGAYLMGFSGEMAQAILGLFFLTLVASGFVLVLPAWVDEHFDAEILKTRKTTNIENLRRKF